MNIRAIKWGLIIVASGAAAAALSFGGPFSPEAPGCGNEVLAKMPSPDGRHTAVVFRRDCGATTGLSTQVSVLESAAALGNSAGNAFIADTNRGAAPPGPGGGPVVRLQWRGPSLLVVSHDAAARVFAAESKIESVSIHYEQLAR